MCSTKKTSVALLREETFRSIEKGTLAPADEAALLKLGIIVPDREEEKRLMLDYINGLNARNSELNMTAVLNLDCNFACTYCFEGGMKGKRYMSRETAGLLVKFIQDRFSGIKTSLSVTFYGGEPLLSLDLIVFISEALKAFAAERAAQYTFNMITNGSLFTRSVAERLIPLGLRGAKITLDGPAEVHNRCRPFKSGAGSFDAVMKNIKDTCDLVKISIGGNYQKENYARFPELLDLLESSGITPAYVSKVKFDPVAGRPDREGATVDFADGCLSLNEPWLVDASLLLREAILRKGYDVPKLRPLPCQLEVNDAYVSNFDGTLYKCPALIGIKDFEIGSLREEIKGENDSPYPGIWKNKECLECAYLPLCFGGCRYMAYVRGGNIEKVDCKRPYLDAALETIVSQDIRYRGVPVK